MPVFERLTRTLGDTLAELIWPTRCCSCNAIGPLLCDDCRAALPLIDPDTACPTCGAPYGQLVCSACCDPHPERKMSESERRLFDQGLYTPQPFPFTQARCCASYEGVARDLITTYKDADEVRLDTIIAELFVGTIGDWADWADALVAIPTTPEALRKRGYDHMDRLARLIAQACDLPLVAALASHKALDQRLLSAEERQRNLADSLTSTKTADELVGARVLLIDDVMTTGATLAMATNRLLSSGVFEVKVAAFARVW